MIKAEKITGFKRLTSEVVIKDNFGRLFYYRGKNAKNDFPYFNLPKGEYFIEKGKIEKAGSPVIFITPELPKAERIIPLPYKGIKVIKKDIPDKARVSRYEDERKAVMIFSPVFFQSKPFLAFAIGHEFGHYRYKTESYCDLFAAAQMLRNGYNPSQIYIGCHLTLSRSNHAEERKENIRNFLKQTKTKW